MRLNISRIKTKSACDMKYYYQYISPILGGKGFVLDGYPREAAAFGTAVHLALHHLALKPDEVDEAIAIGQQSLTEAAGEYLKAGRTEAANRVLFGFGGGEFPCKACDGTGKTLKMKKPHALCGGTGKLYRSGVEGTDYLDLMIRAYQEERASMDHWGEVLLAEKELEIDIGGGITITGKPDKVIRRNETLWHMNHKTLYASASFELLEKQYDLDWHETAYQLMIEYQWGEDCKGSYIDFLRKTKKPTFYRSMHPRSKAMQNNHLMAWRRTATRIKYLEKLPPDDAEKIIVRNTTACVTFNRICPYIRCCTRQVVASDKNHLIENRYVPRKDDYVDVGEGAYEDPKTGTTSSRG